MKWLVVIGILKCCLFGVIANDTLVLVHLIMRHCERTPDENELYPSSPFYNESIFAPYGYGQLTNEGKKNCYDIGTALRKRYKTFLDPSYHYSIVEGISSESARTKESLQLVLAALFPPTDELTWLPGLNWLPIATYYSKTEEDKMFLPFGTDWFMKEFHEFEQTIEAKNISASFRNLTNYIQNQTGLDDIEFVKTALLINGMEFSEKFGLTLPDWMKAIYPNETKKYYVEYQTYEYTTEKLKRMLCGYLLQKIVEESEMRINGTSRKKILIYSGHDGTLASLLISLNLWEKILYPPGSYCILEVHNITGTYGLKIYYFNYTSVEPIMVKIPGFDEFIPLEEFKIQKQAYLNLEDLEAYSSCVMNSVNIFVLCFLLYINFPLKLY